MSHALLQLIADGGVTRGARAAKPSGMRRQGIGDLDSCSIVECVATMNLASQRTQVRATIVALPCIALDRVRSVHGHLNVAGRDEWCDRASVGIQHRWIATDPSRHAAHRRRLEHQCVALSSTRPQVNRVTRRCALTIRIAELRDCNLDVLSEHRLEALVHRQAAAAEQRGAECHCASDADTLPLRPEFSAERSAVGDRCLSNPFPLQIARLSS